MSRSTGKEKLGIEGLGQIAINARQIDRATAFYRDVLGLPHLFSAGSLSFFRCGDVRLMLDVAEDEEHAHPASILYYRVTELEAAHGRLVDRGAACIREPHLIHQAPDHDLWMAFYRDSEENTFALMCERQRD